MNFKDLKDLVEKKRAVRRAQARKSRKQTETGPEIKPGTPVEETAAETAGVGENIPTDESAEGTPVEEAPVTEAPVEEAPVTEAPIEEIPAEEAPKKKSRKKRRASEVEDGAAE